jgi:hypothetical protein
LHELLIASFEGGLCPFCFVTHGCQQMVPRGLFNFEQGFDGFWFFEEGFFCSLGVSDSFLDFIASQAF